jgi:hypothetical protein
MAASTRLACRLRMTLQGLEPVQLSGSSGRDATVRGSHSGKSLVESVSAR